MKIARPDLAAYGLVALDVVAIAVLAALKVPVPEILPSLGMVALGIGGGAALPRGTSPDSPAAYAVPAPVIESPAIPAPALAPLLERAPVEAVHAP